MPLGKYYLVLIVFHTFLMNNVNKAILSFTISIHIVISAKVFISLVVLFLYNFVVILFVTNSNAHVINVDK